MRKFNDNKLNKELAGKTVECSFYMSDVVVKDQCFSNTPIVIKFTDGTYLIPMNSELNDGGALYIGLPTQDKMIDFVIPCKVVEQ